MKTIKIILVDDHQVVIDGLKASLLPYDDIDIIADASNGNELFDKLNTHSPDIIILDIAMPDMNGIEACKRLKEDYPEMKVIFFTGDEDKEVFFEALESGANAFLTKETKREELTECIYTVFRGENYIGRSLSNTVIMDYMKKERGSTESSNKEVILSERETEVLVLIAEGMTYQQIGDKLFISNKTVEKHKRNILHKLNLGTTVDLVKYAIKNKIVDL